ncbi:antitoxin [Pollutimonas subterranea]|uniref:Antitoxin n=1 Tax=Pollutimonas subterranea TaxID=2045210 RepID=A0A2N4U2Z8_9BURK|nr:antitoxin Xre/MbcA/ParS toxin-binding domain-containing protein [Pollutimonas subterranea]PLC49385.1 antitoxin [Pollutimonas subterranea]
MFAEIMGDALYAEYRSRLNALLRIPEHATENQVHQQIVAGFPVSCLIAMCERGDISTTGRDQIIALHTLEIRLSNEQPLTVDESDRLFRAAHIISMAEAIFGDPQKARRWLNKPKERFNGKTPMAMLLTLQGTRLAEEMLLQITEGYAL